MIEFIGSASREEAPQVAAAASSWAQNFLACGEAGIRGFESTRLTPYFHLIATHAPYMVAEIGGLSRFSGEKLEALNDSFKRGHMRQTNSQDMKASIITQKRREVALRDENLRRQKQKANRLPKLGCQVNLKVTECFLRN